MELTPSELDRLLIFNVAQLAQARRLRGVKLNKPEAVALISHAVIEAARDGVVGVTTQDGRNAYGYRHY